MPFNITWQGLVAGAILGIVLAPQIRKLPFVNSLPTV
jgi:hypothetical protein